MRWSTFLMGAVGLAVLQLVVSSQQSASNVGGFISGLGSFVDKFVSPAYPGLSPASSSATTSSTTTASTAAPALVSSTTPPAPPALTPAGVSAYPVVGTGPVLAT